MTFFLKRIDRVLAFKFKYLSLKSSQKTYLKTDFPVTEAQLTK